jgi:YlmC/YmxH family sporulation protein
VNIITGEDIFMNCCITDLTRKEVINIRTGNSLGNVGDVEVNVCNGQLTAIVLYPGRIFGPFGKPDAFRVPWDDIKVIGEDTVLVDIDERGCFCRDERKPLLDGFFRH